MTLTKRLILASRSPRRLSLLRQIGFSPEVIPCDIPEDFDAAKSPDENARFLAREKAWTVARSVADGYVVAADTIVVVDGLMLGKPVDWDDAVRMLSLLNGRTHEVVTAFAIIDRPSGKERVEAETTRVTFRPMSREEIVSYVDGGSPMDKAGAYGIQDDYGAVFITRIEGCFYNVVGLPLAKFHLTLSDFQSHLMQR